MSCPACDNCDKKINQEYCIINISPEQVLCICRYCFCHDRSLYNNVDIVFKNTMARQSVG